MKTMGIKELQTNPAVLTRSLESKEYTIITKRSKPIGLALSLDDSIITEGLKTSLMIDAYEKGLLSLGQLAQALDISKEKAMKLLSDMGVDVIDYDFDEDLQTVEKLL